MNLTKLSMLTALLLATSAPALSAGVSAATAETSQFDLGDSQIAYRDIGSGPAVLLVNRFRGTLDTWDPLFLDQLAKHRRVITVDYPGIGYSSGEFPADMQTIASGFARLADHLGIERFAVLGWSWGGFVAQTMVLEHADRVSHGIFLGSGPPGGERSPIQPLWLERALKPVNDLADEEILFFEPASTASLNAAQRSHERIHARPDVDARIPATSEEFDRYFAVSGAYQQDGDAWRERLRQSQLPMLILCGTNDPVVPARDWYPLIGEIPRGQLTILPQSGHGPQHQYPELAARLIETFLQFP